MSLVEAAFEANAAKRRAAVERTRLWKLANPEKAAANRQRAKERNAKPPKPPSARKVAIAAGEKFYMAEKPCKRGHIALHRVDDKKCTECVKLRRRAEYRKKREEIRVRQSAYYQENRAAIRAKQNQSNRENPEASRRRTKAWRKANPEAKRALHRSRRARLRNAEGSHTGEEIMALAKAQRFKCANPACRASIRSVYHADHIQPLKLGGSNWIRNIQLLCAPCNTRKNAADPIEWMQRQGFLL